MKPYLASQLSYPELSLVLRLAGTAEVLITRSDKASVRGPAMLVDTRCDLSGIRDHLHSNIELEFQVQLPMIW
jgi:hypothetical protein